MDGKFDHEFEYRDSDLLYLYPSSPEYHFLVPGNLGYLDDVPLTLGTASLNSCKEIMYLK
jgi:hypothetical protein